MQKTIIVNQPSPEAKEKVSRLLGRLNVEVRNKKIKEQQVLRKNVGA